MPWIIIRSFVFEKLDNEPRRSERVYTARNVYAHVVQSGVINGLLWAFTCSLTVPVVDSLNESKTVYIDIDTWTFVYTHRSNKLNYRFKSLHYLYPVTNKDIYLPATKKTTLANQWRTRKLETMY